MSNGQTSLIRYLSPAVLTTLLAGSDFVVSPILSPASLKAAETDMMDPPPYPAGAEVDLELVLAVDVSYSVDSEEAALQRRGYVDALRHPSVIEAVQSGMLGRIAITYVEWADADYQIQVVDWRIISDQATAYQFAEHLEQAPIKTQLYTALGNALSFSADLIVNNAYDGTRKVIDISSDGTNNEGRWLFQARAEVLAQNITINGLPILNDRPQPGGLATPRQMKLDDYFRDQVIGGPGAFIVAAEDFNDFRAAILSKLIREIAQRPDNTHPRHAAAESHAARTALEKSPHSATQKEQSARAKN